MNIPSLLHSYDDIKITENRKIKNGKDTEIAISILTSMTIRTGPCSMDIFMPKYA